MVLLWPGLLSAKEYADTRWVDDLFEEVFEYSQAQRQLLSDYHAPEAKPSASKNKEITVHPDITYIQAVALYVARDYENAFKAFKFLFLKNMSSPKINFYLGLCAYELGDYDGAIAAYERVLFIEPNNARCHFELGRSYYALKMYEQAEIEFRKVLQLSDDKKLIGAIKKYIAQIDAYRKRHFASGTVSVGVMVDDNVNNGNDCIIPQLGNTPINKQRSDYGHTESAMFRYLYDAGDKNGFFWMNEAVVYSKLYQHENLYDILFGRVQTGLEYKSRQLYLIMPVGYEYLRYGGEAYLYATDLSVKLYYPLNSSSTLYFYAKTKEEINLKAENRAFDAKSLEVSVGMQNMFGELIPGVSLYLTQKTRRKTGGHETSVDSDMQKVKLNYQKKLSESLSLYPQYSYRELRFPKKQDFWFEPAPLERADRSHQLSLSFLYKNTEEESMTLNYTYSDVESTYKLYTYKKGVLGFSYNIMFD